MAMNEFPLSTSYRPGALGAFLPQLPSRNVVSPGITPPAMPTSSFNQRSEMLPQAAGALEAFLPPAVQGPAPDAPLIDRYDDPSRDKWLWLLQASLGTAAAAGRPGATALGAVGEGGSAATGQLIKSQAERARAQREEAVRRAQLAVQLTQAQKELNNRWEVKVADNGDVVKFNKLTGETEVVPSATGPKEKGEHAFLLAQLRDPKLSDEERALVKKRIEVLNTPPGGPNINILPGEKAAAGAFGKGAGERANEDIAAGRSAFDSLRQLNVLEDKLDSINTGPLASPINTLQALADNVGIDLQKQADAVGVRLDKVEDPQVFNAMAESLVIENLKKMGSKPTDRDMAALRSVFPQLGKVKEANRQLIDIMRGQFEGKVRSTQEILEAMEADSDFGSVSKYDRMLFNNARKKYEAEAKRRKQDRAGRQTTEKVAPDVVRTRWLELYSKSPEEAETYLREQKKAGNVTNAIIQSWMGAPK